METILNIVTTSFIFILILITIFNMIVITPGKRAKIIERLGAPLKRARKSGLSIKLPWPIDRIVGTVNLQLQEASADVSVKTDDNAFMTLPVKVQYRASNDPEGAVRAHYELENPEQQIKSYVLNNVKSTASEMEMIALYKNRDAIEKQVQSALQGQFEKYGYIIENVLVDEPQPSNEVQDAFNRVIASKREMEAAQNIADAERIKLVGVAQAGKESKKLQGEGVAEMREAIAKGMDKAIKTLSSAGLSEQESLMLLMDTNRLDTISSAAAHGNIVLIDMHKGGEDLTTTIAAIQASKGIK
jgi:regulator of protease activity HflC (stomatin/prohibitin superfamily)